MAPSLRLIRSPRPLDAFNYYNGRWPIALLRTLGYVTMTFLLWFRWMDWQLDVVPVNHLFNAWMFFSSIGLVIYTMASVQAPAGKRYPWLLMLVNLATPAAWGMLSSWLQYKGVHDPANAPYVQHYPGGTYSWSSDLLFAFISYLAMRHWLYLTGRLAAPEWLHYFRFTSDKKID